MKQQLKTKIIASILIMLIIVGISGCSKSDSKASRTVKAAKEPIKIGAILMLTGDLAVIGQEMQRGIELAVEKTNAQGGINGRKINVLYEDSGFISKEKIVTAAHKLIFVDKVDAVIIDTVNAVKPVAPLFQDNKIPTIVIWDNTKFVEEGVGDYIVSIGFSTEKTGEKMAKFAYEKLNLKKIAIVAHHDEWAEIISQAFKAKFNALGGEIVVFEKLEMEERDFRTVIEKIKHNKADGIYLAFVPLNIDLFLKQAKESGLNLPILGGDTFTDDILTAAGNIAEGVYFTNIYTDDNSLLSSLQQHYKNKYEQEIPSPLLAFTSFGYDGVLVLTEAMKNAKSITHGEIKNALYTVRELPLSGGEAVTITLPGTEPRIERIFHVENGNVIAIE